MDPESASLTEQFLSQGPACHWIWSAEGVFKQLFGDVSRVFGQPAAALAGTRLTESLEGEMLPLWQNRFQRALDGETLTLRERHGSAVWYLSLFPIRACGESRFVGGSAREITHWLAAEQELRYTVLGALKAQEYQRAKTARFLHDAVGQNLTALGLQLDLVRMDLQETLPEIRTRIEDLQGLLESIMGQVREYTYELNPSTVERAGLRPALDRLVERIRERFTGSVRTKVDPSTKLDPKVATAMYHIAQEAVENAVQHSSCSMIEIAVKSIRTGTSLEVRDDGKGFDPADLLDGGRGLGLLSMEHYAAQAGLDLAILSSRGTGTTIRATQPASE
jgi:two-component system NarL family sensor kinase